MSETDAHRHRILLIDDNKAIHDDMRKILCRRDENEPLEAISSAMLGHEVAPSQAPTYEIDSAYQGQDGLALLEAALHDERPYSLAIVDMRMPPGWDGVETIERLWQADARLQVVICSAFSDYTWEQIAERLGHTDRLLILKKPFDRAELQQLVCATTEKWSLTRSVEAKAAELEEAYEEVQRSSERLQYEVTQRRQREAQLRHDALHDDLTGLPNRALLLDRLEHNIERSKRDPDHRFAVLFLDADNFKLVNDSLGHRAGDDLLIKIGRRLQACLRGVDLAARLVDETIARFGGDEFVILLDGLRVFEDVTVVADRIHGAFQQPLEIAGRDVVVAMSIGIATSENACTDPHDLLRDADTALYQAKDSGTQQSAVFSAEMRERALNRLNIEHDLRRVIERRQLRLQYQPIVSLTEGNIVGLEALVRWDHPLRGVIPPGEFIPIAEQTGLIVSIGDWVLEEACVQMQSWRDSGDAGAELSMSVNISAKQLWHTDLSERLDRVIDRSGLPPACLNLEITESLLMETTEEALELLRMIRRRGVGLHMDDFGTGYSSLSYLDTLPFDAIKIDRAFISSLSADRKQASTVLAIQTMARTRSMTVIAEGIETAEQLAQVQSLDCDMGQGYYFARPMDARAVPALLGAAEHWRKSA